MRILSSYDILRTVLITVKLPIVLTEVKLFL